MRFERSDKSRLSQFLVQRCMPVLGMGAFDALTNIEFSSFLRWYVVVELHVPAYTKCFYCTYEMLEENMIKLGMGAFDGGDGFKLWHMTYVLV
ncbi:putative phosphatidylinositol 3-kinase [Helianthus annuus]|uniref:Phosphatidylinositol 3-kinase n=1 Tax=Helianthus annuus TaxID=4232 RepID=A0A9K3JCV8_HELAN|nr:putative phosphatidylinositol 3-kinase [Helianthus annuus]